MPTSTGPQDVLDDLWARIRQSVPPLPPAQIAITTDKPTGYHGPERWSLDDGVLQGLTVPTSVLRDGPDAVLLYLLHDAAHVLCWRRDVADTARHGRYHNLAYVRAAEKVGLEPSPEPRSAYVGYLSPTLPKSTRDLYADILRRLEAMDDEALPTARTPIPRVRPQGRISLQCRCTPPRLIRASPTTASAGPITCGVCESDFI
ncbi:hypothetical protein [Streptomyces sp. CAU 1734]|uniref:hypothetical protein n=1 Tax=Streptomyces sp. CAU 1734 TaxID=3140360 RepID=UPI003260CE3E